MEKKLNRRLQSCKVCKQDVASSAKTCPHCGVKNPTTTWKHGVVGLLLVCLILGYCTHRSPHSDENALKPAASSSTVVKGVTAPVTIDYAQIQETYDRAQKTFAIATDIHTSVENLIKQASLTPSLALSEQMSKYMKLADDTAQNLIFQTQPPADPDLSDAMRQMNSGLTGMFSNISKRARYAIDAGSGNDAVSALEKLNKADEMYNYNMHLFQDQARNVEQLLDAASSTSAPPNQSP